MKITVRGRGREGDRESMNIHKSAEDYLEQILMLQEQKGYVRSIDIAMGLAVSKPSVSFAMKQLRENGYVIMGEENYITLTEKGMEIAQNIYARHKALTRFLIMMGVDNKTALEDACKLEHDISPTTFDAIKRFIGEEKTED